MVDLKKLQSTFITEATELTTELERGLLHLEKSPHDKEIINTIFRFAHTIKGSSGCIGLNDISTFTHIVEEVLELMRQEVIVPDRDIIDLLLKGVDKIKEMVDALATSTLYDFAQCADLLQQMEGLKNKKTIRQFKIIFIPDRTVLKRGIDPIIVIDDLRSLGEIKNINAFTNNVPPLSELDVEGFYLGWEILMETEKDTSDIKKVFEFIDERSEIKILPMTKPERDTPWIGEILVDSGTTKKEDIDEALKSQRRLGDILVENGKATKEDIEKSIEKQTQKKVEAFKNTAFSTIKVDLGKLDHLINLVGEMVIINSMFQQTLQSSAISGRIDNLFSQLQRIGREIQESTMSLRLLPVGEVFQRFTRLVRDLSASKNKNIEIFLSGEDTELDKGVLERITDPLVHLIRNAVDHGIETPDERITNGKPAHGTIQLTAYQMGDSVYIEVEDDGRGLNMAKILEKATSKGLVPPETGLTEEQIFNLIFLPGFSTTDQVTNISGRGVGMDVVKRNVESLNGSIQIRTNEGKGTTISIKLPLTLVILDGLKVLVGNDVYVIPITSVVESLRPEKKNIKTVSVKGEVVDIRGEYIPLLSLHHLFGKPSLKKDPCDAIVVLVSHEDKKRCLLVDGLIGEQQIVIKNLGTATPRVEGIAGGTILGDGKVALVLDVPGIVKMQETVSSKQ